jgi:hypothetical protein
LSPYPLFQLNGSLVIIAENVMGTMKIDESGEPILHHGQRYCAAYINNNCPDPVFSSFFRLIQSSGKNYFN